MLKPIFELHFQSRPQIPSCALLPFLLFYFIFIIIFFGHPTQTFHRRNPSEPGRASSVPIVVRSTHANDLLLSASLLPLSPPLPRFRAPLLRPPPPFSLLISRPFDRAPLDSHQPPLLSPCPCLRPLSAHGSHSVAPSALLHKQPAPAAATDRDRAAAAIAGCSNVDRHSTKRVGVPFSSGSADSLARSPRLARLVDFRCNRRRRRLCLPLRTWATISCISPILSVPIWRPRLSMPLAIPSLDSSSSISARARHTTLTLESTV